MGRTREQSKPFKIDKVTVYRAYLLVKKNKGCAGVDGKSIEKFDKELSKNLYKIWNRMSSGSYFPKPVKEVKIPKDKNSFRSLGIPTVEDRIAQMVVKIIIEPGIDGLFSKSSFGYRPGKSAFQALDKAKENSWRHPWVIDLDIKGFFDNIDHELMMKAVKHHVKEKWILLYVERWLKAKMLNADGELIAKDKGTPQGGVLSPLLANLYLHYGFDLWIKRNYPETQFERYADDIVIHVDSKSMANKMLMDIETRLSSIGLSLNMNKSKIVLCKTSRIHINHENIEFDFLGYSFRPRRAWSYKYKKCFLNFTPAISRKAKKKIYDLIKSWKIHHHPNLTLHELARRLNPIIRGWFNYYGKHYRSALWTIAWHIDNTLVKWARRRYKRFARHKTRAGKWLRKIASFDENLFYHWKFFNLGRK